MESTQTSRGTTSQGNAASDATPPVIRKIRNPSDFVWPILAAGLLAPLLAFLFLILMNPDCGRTSLWAALGIPMIVFFVLGYFGFLALAAGAWPSVLQVRDESFDLREPFEFHIPLSQVPQLIAAFLKAKYAAEFLPPNLSFRCASCAEALPSDAMLAVAQIDQQEHNRSALVVADPELAPFLTSLRKGECPAPECRGTEVEVEWHAKNILQVYEEQGTEPNIGRVSSEAAPSAPPDEPSM